MDNLLERRRLQLGPLFEVGSQSLTAREVCDILGPFLTLERREKIGLVARARQLDFFTVMENIYDRGNVSAVMRTAEAFGLIRFLLIEQPGASFKAANRITRGADKWLDTQLVESTSEALSQLRALGFRVLASSLEASKELKDCDLTQPIALVIGNEKSGISAEMSKGADELFKLPMRGFSQSYNLSVASALCFAEVDRQRQARGPSILSEEMIGIIEANYILRSLDHPERLLEELLLRRNT